MVGSLSTSTSMAAFERMEEKVLKMEAESEATSGLIANDDLEKKFLELEGGSVEDDLQKLKQKTLAGASQSVKALPEGTPIDEVIDSELEELRKRANRE